MRSHALIVLAVLAALLLTRLPILLAGPNLHLSLLMDDAGYYLEGARRAVEAHSWPTTDGIEPTNGFHPLYMLLLIAIQAIVGTDPHVVLPLVMTLQLCLGAAAMVLIARDAALRGAGSSALGVGLLLALNPGWMEHGLCGVENGLSSLLILIAVLRWERRFAPGAPPGTLRAWAVDGLLLGLAVAARTDSALFAAAYVTLGIRRSAQRPRLGAALAGAAVAALTALVVLGPWIAANLSRFGTLLPDSGLALRTRFEAEYGPPFTVASLRASLMILAFWWFRLLCSGGLVPLTGWGLGLALPIERWRSARVSRWMPWAVAAGCALTLLLRGNDTLDIRDVRTAGLEMVLGTLALAGGLCSARPRDVLQRPLWAMLGLYAALTIGAYSFGLRAFQPWYSTGLCLVAVLLPLGRVLGPALRGRASLDIVLLSLMAAQGLLRNRELLVRGARERIHPQYLAEGERLRERLHEFASSAAGPVHFACFDSGKLSYLVHPFPVTNADGVMNHRAALALANGQLDAYFASAGVTEILGEPKRIAEFSAISPFRSVPDSSLGRYLGMDVSRSCRGDHAEKGAGPGRVPPRNGRERVPSVVTRTDRTLFHTGRMRSMSKGKSHDRERRIDRVNWMEFAEAVPREMNTVLLPIGTLEAHGITSLGTDNEIPTRLSEAIAERLNAAVAPTIPYGVTAHLGALAGGTHVPATAFGDYVAAVIGTLAHQGFQNIIVMNGHGGNTDALRDATRRVHEDLGVYVAVFNWWIEMKPFVEESLGVPGGHAGADETAAMLAIAPDQVFPERWDPSLAFEHRDSLSAFPAPGSLLYYGGKRSDPVLDVRKAARFWERVVEHVGEVLEDLVARWNREGMPATQRRRVAERARKGADGRTAEAGAPKSAREKR